MHDATIWLTDDLQMEKMVVDGGTPGSHEVLYWNLCVKASREIEADYVYSHRASSGVKWPKHSWYFCFLYAVEI